MRPILVPSRAVTLPAGLVVHPQAIDLGAWQAHLLKHPLGVSAVRDRAPWNAEGWDATAPPVVAPAQRESVAARIVALEPAGERCAVRELRGARSPVAEPCYVCPPPLIHHCAAILDEAGGIGRGYAAVIEAVLAEVAAPEAVAVPRAELAKRLIAGLRQPAWIEAGTVLGVGLLTFPGGPAAVARINRADGTRVELRLDRGSWKWRTTYRIRQVSAASRWSFLTDHPRPEPSLPLSEMYVVPRRWWEAYGT